MCQPSNSILSYYVTNGHPCRPVEHKSFDLKIGMLATPA